jgi:hypothetical protein
MPSLALSTSHRQRRSGLPHLRTINVLWNPGIGAFFTRPAMVEHQIAGSGPIRGMFSQNGTFNSDKFYVSGSQVYREATIVGVIGGEDSVRFAGGFNGEDDCLVFCSGGLVYRCDGSAVVGVTIPDDTPIYDVAFFGNRFLFFADNGKFYWSALDDPTSIDGLSFATAEAKPDGFVRAVVSLELLYIFGRETVEVWYKTNDTAAPFAPNQGNRIDKGGFSGDLVYENDGRIWFVSNKKLVFAIDGGLSQIADDSVLEALGNSDLTDASLCSVFVDGIEVLVLTDRTGISYAWDGHDWYRWKRSDKPSLNISGSLNVGSTSYVGDMTSGKVWRLDNTVFADDVGHIERVVTAYLPLSGGRQRMINLMLQCARGQGTISVPNPSVEMRHSDDMNTFSDWYDQPLGGVGQYFQHPVWRGLGMIGPPGRLVEFRCTDAVDFAPQVALYNETRL